MQTKVINIDTNQSGTMILVTLPDPERHAAMSDDFDSSDWQAFQAAKGIVKRMGFHYHAPNRVWAISLQADTRGLVSAMDSITQFPSWMLKVSKEAGNHGTKQQGAGIVLTSQDRQLFGHMPADQLAKAAKLDGRLGDVARAIQSGAVTV